MANILCFHRRKAFCSLDTFKIGPPGALYIEIPSINPFELLWGPPVTSPRNSAVPPGTPKASKVLLCQEFTEALLILRVEVQLDFFELNI